MNRILNFLGLSKKPEMLEAAYPHRTDLDAYFSSFGDYLKWRQEEISKINRLQHHDELRPWLSHRDGYLRQAALLKAEALHATDLWTEVFERANDWVPGIRAQARRIALNWLHDASIDVLLPHLLALNNLLRGQRDDHAAFVVQFENWLLQTQNIPSLLKGARNFAQPQLARYCYFLLECTDLAPHQLIDLGLKSADVLTHDKALRLIQKLPSSDQARYAERLLDSRRDYLKWHGLDLLAKSDIGRARERAADYLLSPYTALRDKAHRLSGLSKAAVLAWVQSRVLLTSVPARELRVGLHLLSQTGDSQYTPLVQTFLAHSSPSVQGAALKGLAMLLPDEARPEVLRWVTSDIAALGRAAMAAAKTLQLQPSLEQWQLLLARCERDAVAQRMLALARAQGKWLELGALLEIATLHPQHAAICKNTLINWIAHFNQSWVILDDPCKAWILSRLAVAEQIGSNKRQLDFFIN